MTTILTATRPAPRSPNAATAPAPDGDPTLRFLEKFKDPAAWDHIEPNVPDFAPHKLADAKGNVVADVDEKRMRKVAAKLKEMEERYGVLPRITLGHTIPYQKDAAGNVRPVPQEEQPEIVGWARCSGIGRFGPANEPCLLFTHYYERGKFQEAKKYPYRSVEFYPAGPHENEITGIALLKVDPQLNLGVVTYTREDIAEPYYFVPPRSAEAYMDPTEMPPTNAEASAITPNEPQHVENEEPAPEAEQEFMRCCRKHLPHLMQYHNDVIATHYQGAGAMGAAPSGTNTAMPQPATPAPGGAPGAPPAAAPPGQDTDADRLAREDGDIAAVRYERQLAAVQSDLAAVKQQLAAKDEEARVVTYERDLTLLLAKGRVFSKKKSMEHVRNYNGKGKLATPEQFAAYRAQLEDLCPVDPTAPIAYDRDGAPVHVLQTAPDEAIAPTIPDHKTIDEVVRYQEAHPGMEYEAAWNAVVVQGKNKTAPAAA